ncbi:viral IAP-associated factor-like isoform X1, partial [Dinothrombium tinctorium]
EDTQWNDILRAKGIIKPSAAEEVETKRCDQLAGEQKKNTKDDFDELLDDDDELALREYRIKRLQQIKAEAMKNTFGEVREITKQDYVDEVNKAGDGVYVILHVYKPELPLCKLINKYLNELAQKFPHTKFLKSIAALCIPNYPDSNLPSIFVYLNGELKKQFIGESTFGGLKLKIEG